MNLICFACGLEKKIYVVITLSERSQYFHEGCPRYVLRVVLTFTCQVGIYCTWCTLTWSKQEQIGAIVFRQQSFFLDMREVRLVVPRTSTTSSLKYNIFGSLSLYDELSMVLNIYSSQTLLRMKLAELSRGVCERAFSHNSTYTCPHA